MKRVYGTTHGGAWRESLAHHDHPIYRYLAWETNGHSGMETQTLVNDVLEVRQTLDRVVGSDILVSRIISRPSKCLVKLLLQLQLVRMVLRHIVDNC